MASVNRLGDFILLPEDSLLTHHFIPHDLSRRRGPVSLPAGYSGP